MSINSLVNLFENLFGLIAPILLLLFGLIAPILLLLSFFGTIFSGIFWFIQNNLKNDTKKIYWKKFFSITLAIFVLFATLLVLIWYFADPCGLCL